MRRPSRTFERNCIQSELGPCPFTYVGESKRIWKSRGAEHKPGTNGNIGSACRNHWPRHTPKLCKHFGNRRKNQEQKAFSRVVAFVPRQKLCQRKNTIPQGSRGTGFLP